MPKGWVEFTLAVDFERGRCRFDSLTFDFHVVGTNLTRNLTDEPTDEFEPYRPFLEGAHGRWTVLEILVPGDRRGSFLLGFDSARGQALVTSVPGEGPGVLRGVLDLLFGLGFDDAPPPPPPEWPPKPKKTRTVTQKERSRSDGSSACLESEYAWMGSMLGQSGDWLPDFDGLFDVIN